MQNYQTKLTICLEFMWDLQGPHSGAQKMREPKKGKVWGKTLSKDFFAFK